MTTLNPSPHQDADTGQAEQESNPQPIPDNKSPNSELLQFDAILTNGQDQSAELNTSEPKKMIDQLTAGLRKMLDQMSSEWKLKCGKLQFKQNLV